MKFIKFKNLSKDEWIYLGLTFLITVFFLIQHYFFLGWDFAAYKLNGDYIFGRGGYFEWYRAPMPVLLLGFLGIFGVVGEYMFIALVSLLFFYALFRLSKALELNPLFLLFPFLIPLFFRNALTEGSELLSLGFLILFLVGLFEKKDYGVFLGLAFLSRYQFLYLLPLLLFYKNLRKILKNLIFFSMPLAIWFSFNYIMKGNFFVSLFDSYLFNVKFRREYIELTFSLLEFIKPFLILLPLIVLGMIYSFKNKFKYVFWFILFASFYIYYSTPIKVERYLFAFLLPYCYFCGLALDRINKIIKIKFFILLFLIVLAIIGLGAIKIENILSVHEEAKGKVIELLN